MRKVALILLAVASALVVAVAVRGHGPSGAQASSHREAPLISQDPTADNTDTYFFRSPDKPDTVTLLANWIPGEDPAAGPNWYTFSTTARYDLYVDRNGDGKPDVWYYFRFANGKPVAFLGNTQQTYTVTKVVGGKSTVVGSGLLTPPDNIGPRSTPDYASLAAKASTRSPTAAPSSPASVTMASSATSAQCSTSSGSATAPAQPAAGRTSWAAMRCTPSPSRCRSRSSTTRRTSSACGRRPTVRSSRSRTASRGRAGSRSRVSETRSSTSS